MKVVSRSLRVAFAPALDAVRKETLRNQSYTVYPVVALVEGVLHASTARHPELALAEEFGMFPEGWNGRPVLISHPKINGAYVSAAMPQLWESEVIGFLFNTHLDGDKLRSEVWVNDEWADSVQDQESIAYLRSGKPLEVSTGLFTQIQAAQGEFNGKRFSGIWRNVTPDHLAILPPGVKGACSVEDGCGIPRINSDTGVNSTVQGLDMSLNQSTPPQALNLAANCSPAAPAAPDATNLANQGAQLSAMDRFFEALVGVFSRMNTQPVVNATISDSDSGVADDVKQDPPGDPQRATDNAAPAAAPVGTPAPATAPVAEPAVAAAATTQLASLEELKEVVTPELHSQLEQGMKMLSTHRDTLVSRILAAPKNKFTKEELEGMNIATLENVSAIADAPQATFEGRALSDLTQNPVDPQAGLNMPPKVFTGKKAA